MYVVSVLDYGTGSVHIYRNQPDRDNEETEDWLEKEKGHKVSDCYFMITDQDEFQLKEE